MESFGTSNGQVLEIWECDLSDQADAWPVYPSMNVCQISPSWKQNESCSVSSLYNAQLLAHFSNTQFVSVQLKTNHHYEWGADKSLARPGRKKATMTKLGFIQHTPHEAQYTS